MTLSLGLMRKSRGNQTTSSWRMRSTTGASPAMLNKELDQALADCNAALSKNPKSSDVLDSRGFVHLRLGEWDRAIKDYRRSLELQPKSAWTRYGLGLAELKSGLKADGQRDVQTAVTSDPKVAQRYRSVGLVPPEEQGAGDGHTGGDEKNP